MDNDILLHVHLGFNTIDNMVNMLGLVPSFLQPQLTPTSANILMMVQLLITKCKASSDSSSQKGNHHCSC